VDSTPVSDSYRHIYQLLSIYKNGLVMVLFLMKNLLMTTTLYLVLSISQAWSVPTCPGSPQTDGFLKNWNNCEGTYISTVD